MTPPKISTPLILPAPLTEQECAEFRSLGLFKDHSGVAGYTDSRLTGLPDSTTPEELLERHFDASNHALLRMLTQDSAIPLEALTYRIGTSWMREQPNDFLHNQLLVTESLYRHQINVSNTNFINTMLGINRNPLPKNKVSRITTVEELEGITAVYRFVQGVGIESHNLGNENGWTTFIWNRHLDRMLRADPSLVDLALPFFKAHVLGSTKADLAPFHEYLDLKLAPALIDGWL